MSKVVITKDRQGKLCGLDPAGQRAYAKWRKLVLDLPVGQTLTFSYRLARSPRHHRLFFAKLQELLRRTEAFQVMDHLRHWVVMGAGYADFVPGVDGTPNAIPRSIDFDSLDEVEFSELHRAVDAFLWTERAHVALWPELSAQQRWDCMDSFMKTFER
ncbi:DUF1367 family protein [Diaphorobacter caeni]|uniref:DUF1367 family protein n=1 Tax=Diaphorobacter caeni TaxID=2784387 RepID=UPI00188E491F|nr:DUF1367 family protein [Diaphorobacter caeni]MBF5006866.1 DUF1367 family protein [Diaphorobacter caeni]